MQQREWYDSESLYHEPFHGGKRNSSPAFLLSAFAKTLHEAKHDHITGTTDTSSAKQCRATCDSRETPDC